MEELETVVDEFYDVLAENEGKESELEEIRNEKYDQAEKIIVDRSKYEYNFLLKEFSRFIKNILKDYSNAEERLINRVISEKEIVYSDYYAQDAVNYLKEFLERKNLGTVKYNKVIIWNEGITLNKLIKSYIESLNSLKYLMISGKELKEEYFQMLEDDKKEYEPLLTNDFKNVMVCKENIPYRVYYDLQVRLESYNYDKHIVNDIDVEKINKMFNVDDMNKYELIDLIKYLRRIKKSNHKKIK